MKLNSVVAHSTHSSAQPDRCSAINAQVEDELQQEIAIAGHIQRVPRDGIEAELAGHAVAVDG